MRKAAPDVKPTITASEMRFTRMPNRSRPIKIWIMPTKNASENASCAHWYDISSTGCPFNVVGIDSRV